MKLLDKYSVKASESETKVCLELYSYSKRIRVEMFKPILEALSSKYSYSEKKEIEDFFDSMNQIEEENIVSFILSFMNKDYGYIYPAIYAIHFELSNETLSFLDEKYDFAKIEKENKQKIRKLFLTKNNIAVHKLLMTELDWFDHFCYENKCSGYIKNCFPLTSHSLMIGNVINLELKKKSEANLVLNEILKNRLKESDYKKMKTFLSLSKQDEFNYLKDIENADELIEHESLFKGDSNNSYVVIKKVFSKFESLILSFFAKTRFRHYLTVENITTNKKDLIDFNSLKNLNITEKDFNIFIGHKSNTNHFSRSVYDRRTMFHSIRPKYNNDSSNYSEIDLNGDFFTSMKSWLREYDQTRLFGAVVLVESTSYRNSEADQYGVISSFHYDENKQDYVATIYLADVKENRAIIVYRTLSSLWNKKRLSKDEAMIFYHDMSLLKAQYSIDCVYKNLSR